MNELRKLLGDIRVQRDTKHMREVVKKVISYMTQVSAHTHNDCFHGTHWMHSQSAVLN